MKTTNAPIPFPSSMLAGGSVAASTAPGPAFDVESFIHEYYEAWSGTDEDRILSYYADNVVLQIPGVLMEGKEAVRDQFVRPFITAFPGNWHRVKNMICGRGVVNVEFSFEAQHTGPFAGHAATGARVVVPGCGVYEYDSDKRQITAARIYFDVGTLLQSITDFSQNDRNKAAVALHLNERNLSLIINTIPTFAWSARPDGYGDFFNQRWLDYTGMTAEQATGWGWREAIHPDDRKGVVEYWQSCLALGVAGEIEARMRRFDGAYRWFLFRASPLRDESGEIVRWYGANIDIEDRKRGEEALRARELTWRQIVDNIPGLVCTWGAMGEVEFVNRQTLEYFGRTREELVDWALIDAIHPDDLPRVIEARKKSLEAGKTYDSVHRCRRADGMYRWFQVRAQPVRDAGGEITAWYLLLTDIDDRKKAEEALQASERNLSLTINTIPTFIAVTRPDGFILSVNQAALDYHGITLHDTQQDDFRTRFYHPDDWPRLGEELKDALQRGRPFEYEVRALSKDGEYRWFLVRCNPLLDEQGRIERWYVTAFDIEDRKRAEDALARQACVRGDVSATFSKPTLLQQILRGCAEAIVRHLDAAFARIWILSKDESMLELQASAGMYTRLDGSYSRIPVGDLKVGLIAREKKAHFTNDVMNDPHVNDKRWAQHNGMVAFAGYPLVVEDRLIGVVALFARHTLAESILDTLASVADTIAQGIERKRAEEELGASEAFLAEGQRLSRTGSWGWNASTGKLIWSEEHFRILGLDPQATIPSLDIFWERVHPEDRIGLQRTFESAIRDKRDFDQEFRIVTPDWSIRHLHGVGHAILNKANELVEFIGSTMDITDRKRAQERANSQNETIRMALNAFVEELDVKRFLGDVIAVLAKRFQAPFLNLWLFDDSNDVPLLYMSFQHGELVSPEKSPLSRRSPPLPWRAGNISRNPRTIEIPSQASPLERAHLESLKEQSIATLMLVPLVLVEQNLGVCELRFQSAMRFNSDDLDLAQTLVHHMTLALQLSRLVHRNGQIAVTEERNRMAREIHDTLAQSFAGIVLHGEVLSSSIGINKLRTKRALSQMQKLARSGLEEARRSVQALRPKALDGTALPEALEQAAQRICGDAKLSCQFRQRGKPINLSGEVQNELFRIAQEALTNVVKHAQAKSVCITLGSHARRVSLSIKDDGIGLATAEPPDQRHGFGMGTMRERAKGIGGQLHVQSRPGRGTTIRVEVPSLANRSKSKVNQ